MVVIHTMLAVSPSGPTSGAPTGAEADTGQWCRVPNKQLGKFKFARSWSDKQVARAREGVFRGMCGECGHQAELVDSTQDAQGASTVCVDCLDGRTSTILVSFGQGSKRSKEMFVDSSTTWEDVVRWLWNYDGSASGVGPVAQGGAHASRFTLVGGLAPHVGEGFARVSGFAFGSDLRPVSVG